MMKKTGIVATILLLLAALLLPWSGADAATDGFYNLTEVSSAWDGTDANRLKADTLHEYASAYGDESSVTFTLPWSFSFYGQTYSQITADTNGNIWFTATGFAHSFNLATTGRGPVIAAWNDDLTSYNYGGVFIQHKTNPERVVVEWQAETYTEEGSSLPNDFEVVIYPNGSARFDYKSFATAMGKDFGSGVSRGDGSASISLTAAYGNVFTLVGRSFTVGVPLTVQITSPTGISASAAPLLNYSASGGTVTVTVDGVAVNKVSGQALDLLPDGVYTIQVNATDAAGVTGSASTTFTVDTTAPSITITSPVAGPTNNKTPVLNYTVSDGAVTVKVDGIVVAKTSGQSLDSLADGPHAVLVQSIDAAGNTGSASVTFTIDTSLPVTTASPVGGTYSSAQSVTLTTTKDATIYYTTDGSTPTTSSAVYSGPITINSSRSLKYFSKDACGNSSEIQVQNYVIDTVSPVLQVSTLASGSYTNNNILNITGSVSDTTAGIKDLKINNVAVPVKTDGSYSHALILTNGANLITIVATDQLDNQASDSRTITLYQAAPNLVIMSPADNIKTATAHLTVSGTVDETSTVTVKLGNNLQSTTMNGTNFSADITLVPGTNSIDVIATDLAGNANTRKRTVVFDDQRPNLAITEPAQDITTNLASLTIRGSVSDPGTAATIAIAMDGQTYTPATVNGQFEQVVSFTAEKSYAVTVTATNEVGAVSSVQRNVIYTTILPVTTATPLGGIYSSPQTVSLTSNVPATIYYTLDGSAPTESSAVYTAPLSITATKTLKYFAKDLAGNFETTQTQTYTIHVGSVTAPKLSGSLTDLGACGNDFYRSIAATSPTNLHICSNNGICGDITMSGGTVSGAIDFYGVTCTSTASTITCGTGQLVFSDGIPAFFDESGRLRSGAGYAGDTVGGVLRFYEGWIDWNDDMEDYYCNSDHQDSRLFVGYTVPVWSGAVGYEAYSVALDGVGGIYVAGNGLPTLQKFTTSSANRVWSGTTNINPGSVAVDGSGGIYISDRYGNAVKKFTTASSSPIWTGNTGGWSGSVAVDAAGGIYVTCGSAVLKFTTASSSPVWSGSAYTPVSVVVDGAGGIYVANQYNNTVQKFTTASSLPVWTGHTGNWPVSVAVDGAGGIYVANYFDNTVQKFTVTSSSPVWTGTTAENPGSLALDGVGGIYVANFSAYANSLQKFTTSSPLPVWSATTLVNPRGIAVVVSGDIYAVIGSTLQKITPTAP